MVGADRHRSQEERRHGTLKPEARQKDAAHKVVIAADSGAIAAGLWRPPEEFSGQGTHSPSLSLAMGIGKRSDDQPFHRIGVAAPAG
ncbi:hypothetical protein [Cyanobium sp. NIES-981]|uniref:hypothetical protein n=1 Tax=Cyanobium sp. NIES-981 TaxID=1851505 RepID=UPI001560E54C|nr:hypothetical protein [Cyanobium sp. NIES-981]